MNRPNRYQPIHKALRAALFDAARVTLERAIECLPPGFRIIFVLHDVEGYEHNEIAEMMGCSIAFMRMPRLPHSTARLRMSASTPALETAEGTT